MRKLISLVVVFFLSVRSRGHRGTERVSGKTGYGSFHPGSG